MMIEPFWRTKRLTEMTVTEWESLCDGCGKCCLHKLCDDETGELSYTNVACHQLDLGTCACRNYGTRSTYVPDCVQLTADAVEGLAWLPSTCAYRLVAAGKDLPWWHPLVSGDAETVHTAGISVRGRAISEKLRNGKIASAMLLTHHIVDWWD